MHRIAQIARRTLPLWVLTLVAVAALTTARVGAQEPPAPLSQEAALQALGAGFTFHGELARGGTLYNGACDFTFSLWDAAAEGTQLGTSQAVAGVNVGGGVFSVVLNEAGQFGPSAFDGNPRWLGIQVKCSGDEPLTDLGRQPLHPTPYAIYADSAGLVGTSAGSSIVSALNDPATSGTISSARLPIPDAVGTSAGSSIVSALNDPATSGTISSARLPDDVLRFVPAEPQLSVGDANGTAAMINLRGGSTCCAGPGGHTPAFFKVFQNGSFVATGNLGIGVSPMQGKGYRTSWDSYKGAFRSGYADNEWDDATVGFFSWAGGSNSTASGLYALAFGDTNFARSTSSIAFGSGNEVKGAAGFSAGAGNRVCDTYGVALGYKAISGGPILADGKCDPDTFNIRGLAAVAIGYNVTADQDHTMALGKFASNNGFSGTFIWSDGSAQVSADTFRNTANNEFAARATGGFRFRTNLGGTTGCNLPAGSGVFNCTSDRNEKEDFSPVDGEAVLSSIAGMPIQSWSYRDDPAKTRHLGPTAQDFHAAFGLGDSDTSIGLLDIDGVNMLAIQALEKRTHELQERVAQLEAERAADQQQLDELEERLAALERAGGAAPAAGSDWRLGGGALLAATAFGSWQLRLRAPRKERA